MRKWVTMCFSWCFIYIYNAQKLKHKQFFFCVYYGTLQKPKLQLYFITNSCIIFQLIPFGNKAIYGLLWYSLRTTILTWDAPTLLYSTSCQIQRRLKKLTLTGECVLVFIFLSSFLLHFILLFILSSLFPAASSLPPWRFLSAFLGW